MRFGVLGQTRAWRADGTEIPLGGPARRALLALLLERPGEVVPAGLLVDELYGGDGAHALQAQVSRLRRDLVVERVGSGYRLDARPEDVDAGRFERLADEGRAALRAGDPEGAARLLREALGLWRGEAFADAPGRATAHRLEERRLTALEDRLEADLASGRDVVPELRGLAAAHPLRERLHALLMRALRAEGRPAEALSVFEGTRRTLAAELGADPSPDLAGLHRDLLTAAPARPPAPLTGFVGRADEIAGLRGLLADARLVTLVGPGGVGKTRLAIEVTRRWDGEVCFVPLAAVGEAAGLPLALLGALGLRDGGLLSGPGGEPVERLVTALGDRDLLLVLDNCEHLVEPVADLAWGLLSSCPGLRVLATGREPLGVTGEHLWQVRPLPGDAAERLFTERARAVRRGFVPDARVGRACRALDDLPLAIELAAARLRTLTLDELTDRLDDRLGDRLGLPGSRAGEARHRTLRAVVEWSWDLLTGDERRAAARFSVFAGGATAAAARAVCGLGTPESLVDKSLLEFDNGRFRMLETIRAYAAERLAALGGTADAERAHLAHHLETARALAPDLLGRGQLAALRALAADHDDLMAALRRTVRAGDVDAGLRLLAALSTYLWISGRCRDAAGTAGALLDLAGDAVPAGLEEEYALCATVAASDRAGLAAWRRHRDTAAAAVLAGDGPRRHPALGFLWLMARAADSSIELAYALIRADLRSPHPWARAAAHLMCGYPETARGDAARAEAEFGRARTLFREAGDRWGTAFATDSLAGLLALRGEWDRAVALTDEALRLMEELGAVDDQCDLLCNRGDQRFAADPDGAREDYARAAGLARRAGSATYLASALRGLGDVALWRGDVAEAGRLYEEALDRFDPRWLRTLGSRARAFVGAGRVAVRAGDTAGARERFRQAAASAASLGVYYESARAAVAMAGIEPDPEAAARLLGAASALRGALDDGEWRTVADTVRSTLGDDAYDAAFAAGARLGREGALRLLGVGEDVIAAAPVLAGPPVSER
ncbi:ATP-binding protein [Actinomadura kijaniata]|uniref:ATP-binding protein n=1 Tax=Actinomadura kijaniata TaxID=46161 RepID=UPI0008370CEB|nr:BTAD domain-containing putative transcriptional regulator [Actinomadura kijaniata]